MTRACAILASALLASAVAPAATLSTTLTVTGATGSIGASGFTANGPVTLSDIGSGTFSGALPLTIDSSSNLNGTFTITLTTGTTGTINGTLKIPASALTGALTGSATVIGGTGNFAGATGSFPNLTGSLSVVTSSLSITGAGTIITGGTGGGGTGGGAPPTISAVQDAASNTPTVAQGSIFIVKGANLSASGFTQFGPPRPTTSTSGVKVTFTPAGGGAGTDAYLVYLFNQNGVNQIAAILPSTVAVGTYNVTVTSGAASAPFIAQVVANKAALFTQDSSGGGLASVQNFISQSAVDLNRLTTGSVSGVTISPAHPGQAVIAYGTGLGAYAAGDNTASPAFDFRSSLTIAAVVGGVSIPVAYAGRAGFAGEDQINFTLPANIPTGCAVPLQISVNGKLSAPASIAIAPDATSSACAMQGFTTAQLQKLDQGGTITSGAFSITQFALSTAQGSQKISSIGGGFTQLNGFQLASAAETNVSVIQSGTCQVIQATSSGASASSGGGLTYLDAGSVSINGPAGSNLTNQALTKTRNAYSLSNFEGLTIPGQINFLLPAGTYTLTGAGGNDVGPFSSSLPLASPLTVAGGLPTTVARTSPLTLNWTGGNASDLVEITGSTSSTTGTGTSAVTSSATFICLTTAGAGTFTVPASILGQMFATTATSPGLLEVASGNLSTPLAATLKADGSAIPGVFGSFLGIGSTPAYQ